MKKKIYVAGPYRVPDPVENTNIAIRMADKLADLGFSPFCPHAATMFWHVVCPRPEQFWLDYDNEWLPVCDGLLRLPGYSKGADAEVRLAESLAKPVFYSLQELVSWNANVWQMGS